MATEIVNPTLKSEAEFILKDLSGHSITSERKIDVREIQDKIRATLNELLKLEIFAKKRDGDRTQVTHYIASYPIEVEEDEFEERFITIPDLYVNLSNNSGIHNLYKRGKMRDNFIIDNNPTVGSKIMAGGLLGKKGYYVEGFKGIFMDQECVTKGDKMVIQLIIASPNNISETDRLPVIPEQLGEMRRIVKQDILNSQTPEDTIQQGKDNSNLTQAQVDG